MRALMSLSGGMDSTALLMRLLADGYDVTCLTYDYGQKHSIEIERAKANIDYLLDNGIHVGHNVIDLNSAMGSLNSALTTDGIEIPLGHYESEQMKQTVVPNRNAIFSSIMYGHALSISDSEQTDIVIALGVHSGDHEIYPDCRPEFYESLERTFSIGNWGSHRVSFHLPYICGDKSTILEDANASISALGLDFDTVFRNTNTSYNPDANGRSSGKSGADVERILAFHSIGRMDPVEYIGGWDSALASAQLAQREHEESS
ncbi:MAG TPA: 7-cyano-7-deazaguanine synthase [Candidatus Thalassarchaeaceae archaeon]|nr:7-cyano-7-deazaguanine synthase [Candidatus Thalassarchaeaceae archaeon]